MEPLRIVVLTAHAAPGIEALLNDPNRGVTYDIAMVVSTETAFAWSDALEAAHIPLELRAQHPPRNLRDRARHDEELAELAHRAGATHILLCGYPHILTEPFLAQFPERVLAIHDADLSLETAYGGRHAVCDAILAGEPETRTSVYMVTSDVARGPLFLLSAPYPVAPMALDARARGDADFVVAYADLHRRWMLAGAWGSMLRRTMELLAGGLLQIVGDTVWIDGAPGPCRAGDPPRVCHDPERGIPSSCPFIG